MYKYIYIVKYSHISCCLINNIRMGITVMMNLSIFTFSGRIFFKKIKFFGIFISFCISTLHLSVLYIRDPHSIITMPANVPAPNGARPSAIAVLTAQSVVMMTFCLNSLAPRRCGSNFKSIFFPLIMQKSYMGTRCEITLGRKPSVKTSLVRSQHWFRWWLSTARQ